MSVEQIPVPLSDLTIHVMDEASHGGAHHEYEVRAADGKVLGKISFQNGPINENGVNGVIHEALLLVVAHRLAAFQSGPYVSDDNHEALSHVTSANQALFRRTQKRLDRGVEGTRQL
jgi:hypothetical protein